MKTLLWFIIIILSFWVLARIFAPRIIKWFLKKVVTKAQQDMEEKSRQFYQTTENNSPFENNIYAEDDIQVIVKKDIGKKKKQSDLGAEEVEFEEI